MCRLHESGEIISIHLDFPIRDQYLDSHPEYFHLPNHFKAYPYVAMCKQVTDKELLTEVLELSWKGLASKKQLKEYEAQKMLRIKVS